MKKIIFAVLFVALPWVWASAHAWGIVLDEKGEPLGGANA